MALDPQRACPDIRREGVHPLDPPSMAYLPGSWLKTGMRALSIRQPWAELILLGHKTIEVRSKRTHLRERVFIYAGLNRIEPAEEARITQEFEIDVDGLPRGVLVGTVEIVGCLPLKQDVLPLDHDIAWEPPQSREI